MKMIEVYDKFEVFVGYCVYSRKFETWLVFDNKKDLYENKSFDTKAEAIDWLVK